jgi:protein-S-isoprenylcysteine O-methyltransferase Ste14
MFIFFFICLVGVVAVVPLHFVSVEHFKLEEKYGQHKGRRIGDFLSLFSGWGFFLFWAGLWFSPQPRFFISLFSNLSFIFPFVNLSIPIVHLLVFVPLFLSGAYFGIAGVRGITLKVAETHRANEIIVSGVYSIVRHPQYLGGLLAHLGITFLFSAWYSFLSTPIIVLLVFIVSRKEETELAKEFGKEYQSYAEKVPMFVPRFLHRRKKGVPYPKSPLVHKITRKTLD